MARRKYPMNKLLRFFITVPQTRVRSTALIRLAVGLIFTTQGILKYIDPNMGVNRFERIGFTHPGFTAHFVGTFEIICGILVLIGFFTRIAALPLLIIICTAIATTKIPELLRATQGFWFLVSDARTDFAMLGAILLLIFNGPGPMSVDGQHRPGRRES
jgi:putative oxidoreductase